MLAGWPAVEPFDQVAIAHVEDQPSTRPLRWMDLAADAGCRMHPAGYQLAIDERSDEPCPRRNRRVPRVLHRERNGCGLLRRGRGDWPPGESLRRVQGPHKIAPGETALGKELRRVIVGDGLAIALHRLDLDHLCQELGVQRPR